MRKILIILLAALLLATPIAGSEAVENTEDGYEVNIPADWSMQDLVDYYVEAYHLNAENFAISLYCPATGERAAFNETAMLFAASTYKLPLNMYYYEREAEGVYDSSMRIGGTTLASAHFQSIVYSNNELSHAMLYNIGSFYQYKLAMLENYGRMDLAELEIDYWADNYYCTKFMCNTLQYLYEHSETFEELIGYMKQAMPGQYLQTYAGDVEVAHKYGIFFDPKISHNDVGILYTDQPVLAAIYTYGFSDGGIDGEELIGRIGKALIEYQSAQLARERLAVQAAPIKAQAAADVAARQAAETAAAEAQAEAAAAAPAAGTAPLVEDPASADNISPEAAAEDGEAAERSIPANAAAELLPETEGESIPKRALPQALRPWLIVVPIVLAALALALGKLLIGKKKKS